MAMLACPIGNQEFVFPMAILAIAPCLLCIASALDLLPVAATRMGSAEIIILPFAKNEDKAS